MNRRSFFKIVIGSIAVICTGFITKKPKPTALTIQECKGKQKAKTGTVFTYRGCLFATRPYLWGSVLSLQVDPDPTHELMITLPFRSLKDRNIFCESRIRRWKEPNVKIATNKQKVAHCRSQINCVLCDFHSSSADKCLIDSYKIFL